MAKHARHRKRGTRGTGWIYLAGASVAIVAVLTVIAIGAASRDDDDAATGPPIVPTARPAGVPAEGFIYGDPNAPVAVVEYLDFQ